MSEKSQNPHCCAYHAGEHNSSHAPGDLVLWCGEESHASFSVSPEAPEKESAMYIDGQPVGASVLADMEQAIRDGLSFTQWIERRRAK